MIGMGLKKLAEQNGMTVDSGVAYGSLRGYATTLSEGSGWKRIDIATCFGEDTQAISMEAEVRKVDVQKEYWIQQLTFGPKAISVVFQDTIGTMKKLEAFIDWFYPLLEQFGAAHIGVCVECRQEAIGGSWYLIDGIAYYVHEACGQRVCAALAEQDQQRKDADDGSYVQGLLGALAGAALGAVVWALVLLGGYVASIVGFLIGWLAEKGYNLFRGKQGKGKVAILILAIILGVVLGTLVADGFSVAQMIESGEMTGLVNGDIPYLILDNLLYNPEYQSAAFQNIGMGLLFAALGVFTLLRNTGKAVADVKCKKLR